MIADLHAHYPMHVLPEAEGDTHAALLAALRRDRARALLVDWLSRKANYEGPGGTPSVTIPEMRSGGVGIALSVLYSPLDEMDLQLPYGAAPRSSYFETLTRQITAVDNDIERQADATVARSVAAVREALAAGQTAVVHCVEGGHALGATAADITANVRALRAAGVAYITLAHLFFRGVATNAPALPFLPDWLYRLLFPQRGRGGLTELGRAALDAMLANRVLIDVTHMSDAALTDTFDLLQTRDPGKTVPVIASHIACRFGSLRYNATDTTIRAIADRNGVIGLIACEHYMTDGLPASSRRVPDTLGTIFRHIDHIGRVTGSLDHVAVGSDLDGYIKPALPGLRQMRQLAQLETALEARYGASDAEKICHGNALRVLEYWG